MVIWTLRNRIETGNIQGRIIRIAATGIDGEELIRREKQLGSMGVTVRTLLCKMAWTDSPSRIRLERNLLHFWLETVMLWRRSVDVSVIARNELRWFENIFVENEEKIFWLLVYSKNNQCRRAVNKVGRKNIGDYRKYSSGDTCVFAD